MTKRQMSCQSFLSAASICFSRNSITILITGSICNPPGTLSCLTGKLRGAPLAARPLERRVGRLPDHLWAPEQELRWVPPLGRRRSEETLGSGGSAPPRYAAAQTSRRAPLCMSPRRCQGQIANDEGGSIRIRAHRVLRWKPWWARSLRWRDQLPLDQTRTQRYARSSRWLESRASCPTVVARRVKICRSGGRLRHLHERLPALRG